MGIGKGLAFLIGGVLAFEYAAYVTGNGGLGQLANDIVGSCSSHQPIGAVIDTMFQYLGDYGRDFFYDKFSALGFAGQASMYGGLGNIGYNIIKRPKKGEKLEEKVEKG